MLNEERRTIILNTVEQDQSASVQDLMLLLDASESTIRRDLTVLAQRGLLVKVHGGALALSAQPQAVTKDILVAEREEINREAKLAIAKYAAELIKDDDVVYLDAGTTTGVMIDFLTCTNTRFVTDAISHAAKLSQKGYQVFIPGGGLKASTEAMTGAFTCQNLKQYHFTKGFFGSNGITRSTGCTTPDEEEAMVKKAAADNCRECFVLADNSKFGKISTVTFSGFQSVTFITDKELPETYRKEENIIIVN